MTQFNARQVLRLLAARHARDVFVPECKTGETWRKTMHRVDAWAMNRSWLNLTFSGYEIKVARADFVGDDKWPAYLPLCHQFWFATAPGVIHGPAEVPAAAGWLEMTGGGGRLLVRKKAPRRDIELPADLLLYVLMSRAKVVKGWQQANGPSNAEWWRQWVEGRQELKGLGHRVSRALARRLDEQIDQRDTKQALLEIRLSVYEDIRQLLLRLGLDTERVSTWYTARAVEDRLAKAQSLVDPGVLAQCRSLAVQLENLAHALAGEILESPRVTGLMSRACRD